MMHIHVSEASQLKLRLFCQSCDVLFFSGGIRFVVCGVDVVAETNYIIFT